MTGEVGGAGDGEVRAGEIWREESLRADKD